MCTDNRTICLPFLCDKPACTSPLWILNYHWRGVDQPSTTSNCWEHLDKTEPLLGLFHLWILSGTCYQHIHNFSFRCLKKVVINMRHKLSKCTLRDVKSLMKALVHKCSSQLTCSSKKQRRALSVSHGSPLPPTVTLWWCTKALNLPTYSENILARVSATKHLRSNTDYTCAT